MNLHALEALLQRVLARPAAVILLSGMGVFTLLTWKGTKYGIYATIAMPYKVFVNAILITIYFLHRTWLGRMLEGYQYYY